MTEQERDERIAYLERLIKARRRMSGYQNSIKDAQAEIEELKAMTFPEPEPEPVEPLPEPEA